MDEDILENLKELKAHLQSVAIQVGSPKASIVSLTAMSKCLEDAKNTVDIYIKIQLDRFNEEHSEEVS